MTRHLRLAPDVIVTTLGSGFRLESPTHVLETPSAPKDWTPIEDLLTDPEAMTAFQKAASLGLLEQAVFREDRLQISIRVHSGSGFPAAQSGPFPYRLVEGFVVEPCGGVWRLSSPFAHATAWMADPGLLAQLSSPDPQDEATKLLVHAGLLVSAKAPIRRSPLTPAGLHLHALSRRGTAPGQVGARSDAPAREPSVAANAMPLPASGVLPTTSLTTVLARRRSHRTSAGPVKESDLSRLLAMAARTRPDGRFPAPSPGWLNDIELFIARPGAFAKYLPQQHALAPIDADPEPLLADASRSIGEDCHTLITLASPFERIAVRYGDAAYPLLLKTAGALMQTLHLSATALGLGSCLIGGGNSLDFARLSARDPLNYGPIGEIALTGPLEHSKDET